MNQQQASSKTNKIKNPSDILIKSKMLDVNSFSAKTHAYCKFTDYARQYETIYNLKVPDYFAKYVKLHPPKGTPEYNPKYYASEVSYTRLEKFVSNNNSKQYFKPKKNTYSLCPYCDPFENSKNESTKRVFDRSTGLTSEVLDNQPRFYDTLHTEYSHHLNDVHGVTKNLKFSLWAQPFIGLSKSQVTKAQPAGELKLTCICPYNQAGTKAPCLAEFAFQTNSKDGNPYKAYFRHASSHHYEKPELKNLKRSISPAEQRTKKPVEFVYKLCVELPNGLPNLNTFVPLSSESFERAWKTYSAVCDLERNPLYSEPGSDLLQKFGIHIDYSDTETQTNGAPDSYMVPEQNCPIPSNQDQMQHAGHDGSLDNNDYSWMNDSFDSIELPTQSNKRKRSHTSIMGNSSSQSGNEQPRKIHKPESLQHQQSTAQYNNQQLETSNYPQQQQIEYYFQPSFQQQQPLYTNQYEDLQAPVCPASNPQKISPSQSSRYMNSLAALDNSMSPSDIISQQQRQPKFDYSFDAINDFNHEINQLGNESVPRSCQGDENPTNSRVDENNKLDIVEDVNENNVDGVNNNMDGVTSIENDLFDGLSWALNIFEDNENFPEFDLQ